MTSSRDEVRPGVPEPAHQHAQTPKE